MIRVALPTDDNTCVKAYNPAKTGEVVGVYDDYWQAGNQLGLHPNAVRNCCGRKGRSYSVRLNMEVALRLSKKEQTA